MAADTASPLLHIEGLKTHFYTDDGVARVLDWHARMEKVSQFG